MLPVVLFVTINIIVAKADPTKKPAVANTGGMLAVVPEGSPPINDLAISSKPGGGVLG